MIPSAKKLLMSISSPPFAGFCIADDRQGRVLLSLPLGFEHGSRLQIYTNILIYINFSKKIFKKYFQLPEFYLLLRMKSSKKIVKGTE